MTWDSVLVNAINIVALALTVSLLTSLYRVKWDNLKLKAEAWTASDNVLLRHIGRVLTCPMCLTLHLVILLSPLVLPGLLGWQTLSKFLCAPLYFGAVTAIIGNSDQDE